MKKEERRAGRHNHRLSLPFFFFSLSTRVSPTCIHNVFDVARDLDLASFSGVPYWSPKTCWPPFPRRRPLPKPAFPALSFVGSALVKNSDLDQNKQKKKQRKKETPKKKEKKAGKYYISRGLFFFLSLFPYR